jgi:hypothetical protein
MKYMKLMIWVIAVVGLVVAGSIQPAEAASGHGGGGFHGGGGSHGSGWHGGGGSHGGGWHGHGGHGGTHVFIGGSFGWWGWPWWGYGWWGAPYYPYYYGAPYPYYYSAPPAAQTGPTEYIQQAPAPPEQSYWYYCRSAGGYYPYVKDCAEGWMQVVPQPGPQATPQPSPPTR